LEKRHKRQVTRAREKVKLSEPDVRTPEQIKAAREASRAIAGHSSAPLAPYAATPSASHSGAAGNAAAKPDTDA
jgi:hypothetical protein